MKQKLGVLCLAAALLVLSGCGGSALSIESHQWELSAVLDDETGAVVACGPSWQEAYPDAAVFSLSCQAQGGHLTLRGQEETYTGTYQQAERSQKDTVYQVTVEGSTGQAVCSTTDHRTGEQAPTLVLTFPRDYTLYFTGTKP